MPTGPSVRDPVLAAFRLQAALALRTPNFWMVQLTTPFQVMIFFSVADHGQAVGDPSVPLTSAVMIALWSTALWTGGGVGRDDRWEQRLELHEIAPVPYATVLVARVLAIVTSALLCLPIAWLAAWIGFGVAVRVTSWPLLLAGLPVFLLALATTGAAFSTVTILSRAPLILQSSASFPLLLLGGAVFPVEFLPGPVQPLSRLVLLSWGADILRGATSADPDPGAWAAIPALALLGGAGWVATKLMLKVIWTRVARTGGLARV